MVEDGRRGFIQLNKAVIAERGNLIIIDGKTIIHYSFLIINLIINCLFFFHNELNRNANRFSDSGMDLKYFSDKQINDFHQDQDDNDCLENNRFPVLQQVFK